MPVRVPTYEPTQAPGALPSARQQAPRTIGATPGLDQALDVSQKLIGAGEQISKIEDLETIERNEYSAKDAAAKYQRRITDRLHNPDTGFLNLKGDNAVAARQSTLDDITKAGDDIGAELPTDRARRMFDQARLGIDTGAQAQIASHVGAEHQNAMLIASKARLESAGNAAVLAYNPTGDNTAFATAMETVRAEAASQARDVLGLTGDLAKQYADDQVAAAHVGVVGHLIATNHAMDARKYFDAHKDEIHDAPTIDKLHQALDNAEGPEEALSLVQKLPRDPIAARKQLVAMHARGEISAKVYGQALQEVEHNYSVDKQVQAEAKVRQMGEAEQWLLQHPGTSVLQMPGNMRLAAINGGYLDHLVSFAKTGGDVQTSTAAMAEVLSMSRTDLAGMSPAEFEAKYRGQLSRGDLFRGMSLVLNARNMPMDAQHLEVYSTSERIKNAAVSAGLLPAAGTPAEEQTRRFLAFQQAVDNGVRAVEQANGGNRKATAAELQAVIDQEVMNTVKVARSFLPDREALASTLNAEDAKQAYVTVGQTRVRLGDIPAPDRQAIEGALRRAGMPVTEAGIAALWLEARKKQQGRK